MKSTSVLAAAALLALAAACSKKEEPRPSETNTTSAPIERDDTLNSPVEVTGGTLTTGTTDHDDVHGGGSAAGTTERAGGTTGSGSMTGTGTSDFASGSGAIGRGHDAGIAPGIITGRPGSEGLKGGSSDGNALDDSRGHRGGNDSTTLGDGTSGQYTGGKGTYGGKATHGTGDKEPSGSSMTK